MVWQVVYQRSQGAHILSRHSTKARAMQWARSWVSDWRRNRIDQCNGLQDWRGVPGRFAAIPLDRESSGTERWRLRHNNMTIGSLVVCQEAQRCA